MVVVALGAVAAVCAAGALVYAWRRDWPRLAACAALGAGAGWLAVRLAVTVAAA